MDHDLRHTTPTSVRTVTTGPSSTIAGPARTPPLDDVGRALLATAGRLLTDEGAGALTVRRIAGESGMSTMNVYSRFGGKHGVVEHLFLEGFRLLAEAMTEVPTTDDPVADLTACGQAYRTFALTHPTLYSVMFEKAVPDYEPGDHALASGLATLQHLAERIERCIAAGRFRPGDPMHLAGIVWSNCHGAVSLELKQKRHIPLDWEAVFRDTCATISRGLEA
jgi:AcrR family transcriptional regulator